MSENRGTKRTAGERDVKSAVDCGIRESDVGITERLYKGPGRISGTLKQRYTDFLVNEIDLEGNVVHLVDEGIQVTVKEPAAEVAAEAATAAAQPEPKEAPQEDAHPEQSAPPKLFEVSPSHMTQLEDHFGPTDTSKILELLGTGGNVVTSKTFDSKDERTKIHHLLREAFNNRLEAITTPSNNFQLALKMRSESRKRRRDRTPHVTLDHGLGQQLNYLRLVIYKENKETMEVAGLLAKFLNIPVKWIKYAGTKDRRGVTVQQASIERMSVERVNNLNKALRGVKIGCFSYSDNPLKLGDLKGNEFIITIKDVQSSSPELSVEESVRPILQSLEQNGFINYFGMQRFGTFSVSTHEIGKHLLQTNWKEAAELILSDQEVVLPGSVEARQIWSTTKNAEQALRKMPRKCSAEFSILSRLARAEKDANGEFSPNAYFTAIMGIPRNLRIMYGHAYQSYVWNAVASRRIQLFGLSVVAGDLVLVEKEGKADAEGAEGDESDFEEDVKKDTFVRARPVTAEEVESGRYNIHDVVLPTPGFDVIYPENEALRQVYVDVMAKDNLDPFKMARRVREFSLAGSYRQVVAKVTNLEYHLRNYEDTAEPLVRTDLEMLHGESEQILPGTPGAANTALILKLRLGVSTYATMALRELMAGDTSRHGDVVSLQTKRNKVEEV